MLPESETCMVTPPERREEGRRHPCMVLPGEAASSSACQVTAGHHALRKLAVCVREPMPVRIFSTTKMRRENVLPAHER